MKPSESQHIGSDAEGVLDLLREVVSELRGVLANSEWKAKDMQLREISRTIDKLDSMNVSVPDDLRRLKTHLAQELTLRDRADEKRADLISGLTAIVDELESFGPSSVDPNGVPKPKRRRARSDSAVAKLLRESIVAALHELGGAAGVREVLEVMESKLKGMLPDEDARQLKDGRPSWHYKSYRERQNLIEDGVMRSDSVQGRWELSPAGENNADEEEDDA